MGIVENGNVLRQPLPPETLRWQSLGLLARRSGMDTAPKILLADDDADVRQFYRAALEDSFRLLLARDGEEAWQLIESERPRLLVSDLNMPGLDGLQLVQRLRTHPAFASLPIIVVTGTIVGSDLPPNFWKAGIDADLILEKPVAPETLRQAIIRLLVASMERPGTPPPPVEYFTGVPGEQGGGAAGLQGETK